FGRWLEAEFQWSDSAAQKFMAVANRFKSVKFTDLTVAPSALYLLAAPSTPEEAVDEALERAAGGERITHAAARGIVDGYRPPVGRVDGRRAGPGENGQRSTVNGQLSTPPRQQFAPSTISNQQSPISNRIHPPSPIARSLTIDR
ncbi:MAG: hypothetical protein KDE23_28555, partial [Caldilinea sp.]|nr:hypothetical protein [Caldilinea sp.]